MSHHRPRAQDVRAGYFCLLMALCVLLTLKAMPVLASEVIPLRAAAAKFDLGGQMRYVEDKEGTLRVDDLLDARMAGAFAPSPAERPAFGFTSATFWFRAVVRNVDATDANWLLEVQYPLLDEVDLYLVYPGNRIVRRTSGDTLPFTQREVAHRNFTFAVPVATGEQVVILLKVRTESSMHVPVALWTERAFFAEVHNEQIGFGLYYGILVALFCYNLLLFLSIRDINFLYYLHYIGGWILFQMSLNGLAFEYLWPENPWWGNRATPFFLFFVALGVLLFTRAFLQLKENLPKLDMVFRFFIVLAAILMASTLVLRYAIVIRLANGLALIGLIMMLVTGFLSIRRKVRQARYFMLAWVCLLVGSIAFILKQFGILPSNFLTDYGMQIGSALEVVLLSLALAHRIRMLQDENVRIQKEATETLEVRVRQRTQELDTALQDLSVASEKLRDLSRTDALTGCRNRACFDELLETEWQRALHSGTPIGLLMLDIDHFKQINDTHGHQGGDACLKQVAQAIRTLIHRPGDESFRYGGEEFAILLPNTDLAGAVHVGENILARIDALTVVYEEKRIPVTVSVGVASIVPEEDMRSETLVTHADKALYEAKRRGRNRVCFSGETNQWMF